MGGWRRRGSPGLGPGRPGPAGHGPAPAPPPPEETLERASHRLYLHLAWATLGRLPLVDDRRAAVVEGHLIDLCRRLGARPLAVSVRCDRIHLIVRSTPSQSPGAVARRLKTGSTAVLLGMETPIRWGRGYAVRSVSPGEVRRLMRLVYSREDRMARPP